MFGEGFKRRFALTDQGVTNAKKGALWTIAVNLIDFAGIVFLYQLMAQLVTALTEGGGLPSILPYAALLVAFVVVSFLAHKQQYFNTYGTVYHEVGVLRIGLAERLRRLPLSFFMGRDLADLSETIMGDVDALEHVWSHVLGYLYGAYVSTAIVAVGLLAFEWRLALAVLWSVPLAFGLLFGLRRMTLESQRAARADSLEVSDAIQETLENVREIRATNQEERYLDGLREKIDHAEASQTASELKTGLLSLIHISEPTRH